MIRILMSATCLCLLLAADPAYAEDYLGSYTAYIGPEDFYNSSGARISSVCGVLQQDRTNYHRFGKRDPQDQGDPYFATPAARAVIGRACVAAQGHQPRIIDAIRAGRPIAVPVTVIGSGTTPMRVIFGEIAG
ncbi:hypothetical protein [Primorskyibacter sp. S187A]|uniref:hypothetical protein n=1 Tax=Primorskyibacter sp. S187A TaxID=3415130 RepID=UPI003C7E541B